MGTSIRIIRAACVAAAGPPRFVEGPCTKPARDSMPAGREHDHEDIRRRFSCNLRETSFLSLVPELKARPDVVFGEMDVKGEGAVSDTDCGAFVDLSPDGKRVYVSVQVISVVPGGLPPIGVMPAAYPGVDVVDISDRRAPRLIQKLPYVSVGVHTARSFEVPGKGEYVVAVANLVGATIGKVVNGLIVPVHTIQMDELHDTFVQRDPLTGKTLLYIAGGYDSGFYIYDISTPESPVPLAEWDTTPECASDWFGHTIDVTTVNGRRVVVLTTELIDGIGEQPPEDQAEGCGNGDFNGPVCFVDATDFSKLGAADPTDDEATEQASDMKARSEAALITTWSNAANPAGGKVVYTPHNQQIVGNHLYPSSFHGGVVVLDATEAFAGRNVRPKEIGLVVPTGPETRPIHPLAGTLGVDPLGPYTELTDEVKRKKPARCMTPRRGASRAERRAYAQCERKRGRK